MFFFLVPLVLCAMSLAASAMLVSLPFAFLGGVFGVASVLFLILGELQLKADQRRWNQLAEEARHG